MQFKLKMKTLIVFDAMIVDMPSNKKLQPKVTELSIKNRKTNASLDFITNLIFQ